MKLLIIGEYHRNKPNSGRLYFPAIHGIDEKLISSKLNVEIE